jgi:NADH-quinone oxidoreductase subunit F
VNNPGVFETPNGISLKEIIYSDEYAGGLPEGRELAWVVPGGLSCPILMPDEIDVGMDFDQMQEAGSMGGTSGVMVFDDQSCPVRIAARTAHFYHHESCGQCTPCREGSGWVAKILDQMEAGNGKESDLQLLLDICENVEGNTICPLGDALAMPIRSYVQKFEDVFRRHVEQSACEYPKW